MALSKATSPQPHPSLSQGLLSTPHGLVLQRHAARVVEAIGSVQTLPEEVLKQAWPDLDGAFALAAQDRLDLVERQQRATREGPCPCWRRPVWIPAPARLLPAGGGGRPPGTRHGHL